MKFIYSFLFFIFIGGGLSATNNHTLEWFKNTSSKIVLPDFDNSVHLENQALPLYSETQMPENQADAYTAKLKYPVFQKLTSEETRLLRPYLKNFSDSIDIKISLGIKRKKQMLDLSFYPFIKKGSSYYKLISFDWDIQPVVSKLRSSSAVSSTTKYTGTSALASGKWRKISVTESGVYKLTYQDIKDMGINPNLVQIYGYGGALLNEDFSVSGYLDDLPEVAIWKELGSDSIFNAGDYILFYAQGPVSWTYNRSSGVYTRVRNHYSDKAYYFVGERSSGSKIATLSTNTDAPNKEITSFTDYQLHETDRVNIGESVAASGTGRELYGEDFTASPSQNFEFNVPNIDTTQNSHVQVEFIAHNTGTSSCSVYVNDKWLTSLSMSAISTTGNDIYVYARSSNDVVSFLPSGETTNVRLDYYINGSSATPRANLNYIILTMRRFLRMSGAFLQFRDPNSVGSGNIGEFTIQNANSNTMVFDITDPQSMVRINGKLTGTNYIFTASDTFLHQYVCVDRNGTFSKPNIEGSVTNQNIHGHSQVDMVIIAPSEFTSYAATLAQAHAANDNLNVLVVTPEQVYNEFSSGTPDATAYRRMMKLFYDKAANENELPKYLLLFGDGVYDNRLVSTMFVNSSSYSVHKKLLTYESYESLDGLQSYVSDDYFGFLDDSEGSDLSSAKLDIGVGRFPVSSAAEAQIAVDKTISYMKNSTKGVWKNRLLYLADNADSNLHIQQADELATMVGNAHPEFMINKIYLGAYKQVTTISGSTMPDANISFSNLLNSGLLMLNYTGHGSPTQWSAYKLLTTSDIKAMTNKCLPLWVTATCDFARFDAPETSAGEYVFLNSSGGGIALFTTTRIVYSNMNMAINKSFDQNMFSRNNGERYSLGEIMQLAKCSEDLKNDRNKLSFTLIGDPAIQLAYPEYSIKITNVNNHALSSVQDTLKALSTVTVSGKVYKDDSTFANDFSGIVYPTVLGPEETAQTLSANGSDIFYFKDRSKIYFSGKDSVVNGLFNFSFVVPKDINYSYKTGRINLYAYDKSGANEAQGYYDNFVLGGTDTETSLDSTGPKINLYLNDFGFVSGNKVNETPTFIARVSDDNGLNTSGNGIGHDLSLVIDDSPSMTYTLNNYYIADLGSYTSGTVYYVLPSMSTGIHHLSFKAWDVQNNSNTDTIYFVVSSGMSPDISNIKFAQTGETGQFIFTHNRPDVAVSVNLTIYDILGRLIWQATSDMKTDGNLSDIINWDLTDVNGRRVQNGLYLCKILMKDSNGIQTMGSEKIQVTKQ